jgi:PAS domain S-box-containing protein
MNKIKTYLPFLGLLLLPLLFYPSAGTSSWRSSSDVHALLEFASALLAVTAGIMILLHYLSTGSWRYLMISIGFVLIGGEEFVHAIFSFSRIWPDPLPMLKLAISTTWLTGHFVLLAALFIALLFKERRVAPAKMVSHAIIYNIAGFIGAALVAFLIFKAPFLPGIVQLGTSTKKILELSLAILSFVALLLYSKAYFKQRSRSPLLGGIVACIIFRILAHIVVSGTQAFYDAQFDAAHLLIFLSYFFPIFGVWGETLRLQKSAQVQLIELEKLMAERKEGGKALQESEERYRNLFETMIQGVVYQDASGVITSANSAAERVLGLTLDQMQGRTSMDRRWRSIREDGSDFLGEEHPTTVALRTGKIACGIIMGIYNPQTNGTRWISIDAVPKFLPGETKPCQVYSMFTDITERKRTEDALRESQKRFQALTETTSDFIWEMDANGVYTYCSPQINQLWGYKPEDMIGRTPFDLMIPEDKERALRAFCATMESPRSFKGMVTRSRDSAGRIVVQETNGVPFFDGEGGLCGFRGISRDITERNLAEEEIRKTSKELQDKNAELNRFIYAVSHDLKSPLVTIQTFQGHLEQDIRGQDAARLKMDLGYIRGAADKMSRMLDEIRSLSRVGRIVNPSEEAPLQAIVKEALDLVAGRLAVQGVRVDVTEEPVMLYGDRTRLVEVFQNLVDNAAKFMGDQKSPRIEIGVEQAGEELALYMRDNGIGIGPEVQPLVFGLFHKLDPGAEGEGIGLALVKRIVELHGGRIWVESEGRGKGATFRFTLAKTKRAEGRNSPP